MPSRRGAASGGFAALEDVLHGAATGVRQQSNAAADAQRNDLLERGRTADQLIASGKLGPEDRDAYIKGTYTGPSTAQKVGRMIGDITKAPDEAQTPTRVAIGQFAQENKLPVQFGAMPQASVSTDDGLGNASGGDAGVLPSTPMGPISNEVQQMLDARSAKLRAIPPSRFPDTMTGTGADTHQITTPQKWNADSGAFEGTPAYASGPTAGQQGDFTGTSAARAADVERPSKVATAAATTTATKQAETNVQNAPANVAGDARRAAAIAAAVDKAKQDLIASGISPQMANDFVQHTNTGKPYFYIDPSIDQGTRKGVTQRLLNDPALKDGRLVNKDEAHALQQIDEVRGNMKLMATTFQGKLASGPAARLMKAGTNTLAALTQADPELNAALATFYGPSIQAFKQSTGNIPGFRMTQPEIEKAKHAIPEITDTWQTALAKLGQLGDIMETQEERILRK